MKYLFGLFILLITSKGFGQGEQLDWGLQLGVYDNDEVFDSAIDDENNIYLIGSYSGSIEYIPSEDSVYIDYDLYGVTKLIVYKYNSIGTLVWAKEIGGDYTTYGKNITLDTFGNIFISGNFRDTVDFDPGPGVFEMVPTGSSPDVFFSKWDANGNFVWAKQMDGGGTIYVEDLATDLDGNLYSTGDCSRMIDFDPDPDSTHYINTYYDYSHHLFLYKLDSAGNFGYVRKVGGESSQTGEQLEVDEDKNIYVTGYFREITDFDPGLGEYNLDAGEDMNAFIAKYDSIGDLVWAKALEGTHDAYGEAIELDGQGNLFYIGGFKDTIDLDPSASIHQLTTESYHSNNSFISKLDTAGNFIWGKTITSDGSMYIRSLALNPNNDVFLMGWINDTTLFDLDSTLYIPNGSNDVILSKMTEDGDIEWIKQNEGDGIELCYTLEVDGDGNIYTSGMFNNIMDLNPDTNISQLVMPAGYSDTYFQKFRTCHSYSSQSIVSCNEYLSPSGSMLWMNDGIYKDTIQNSAGCDSIITTNLSIVPVDLTVGQLDASLYTNSGGLAYQWLDCNDSYSTIPGATNSNFIPTENGVYAVEITMNGCVDTSLCQGIWNVSLIENTLSDLVTVYPNPFSGPLQIDLPRQYANVHLIISNHLGQEVWNKKFTDTDHIFSDIDLNNGIYNLEVILDRKERSFHKIIKY